MSFPVFVGRYFLSLLGVIFDDAGCYFLCLFGVIFCFVGCYVLFMLGVIFVRAGRYHFFFVVFGSKIFLISSGPFLGRHLSAL